MSYSNGLLPDQSYQTANKYVQKGLPGVGFKLTDTGDYDMQNKKLVNVDEGENNQDVVNKHQLDVGLQTKPNKTDVLLLDGTTHMVGDLDLRGNKIILPGEIQMDRKLITNLDTDENQDLSAVNMITLKNKVEPKADKNYVDFEITKQNALINNTFVKKTGDQMNGNLILPHDSYPVEGNTNKAISYETQREIFLSRRESFPMQADINMNNNFIQNIATPTSSHQGVNKGYCDYNFLNRQKGGRIMGSLSMNQNDLFEIPAPKYESSAANKNYVDNQMGTKADLSKTTTQTFQGRVQVPDFNSGGHNGSDIVNLRYIDGIFLNKKTGGTLNNPLTFLSSLSSNQRQIHNIGSPQFISSAANKQYVDGEIGKIASVDTTQLIKKDGSVPMAADFDMGTHKIENLSDATNTKEAINKGQLDSVNINLETFKNQINTFKIYFKNHFYLSIFTSHFYDLKEPSIFIFDGAAISGINPNMSIKSSGSSHITVSGFDPIRGLQFNSATKIIIDLGYMVNQNTPYTIMISLTLKDHLKVHFVEPTNEQTFYYPGYVVTPSDHTIRIHMSEILYGRKIYPVVFNNKQIMIWIYFNPSERKYEIIIGNGNYVNRILNPLSYFSTNKLRIDANNNIINKICYQNQHFASAETFTKMMFEERKNGSYF